MPWTWRSLQAGGPSLPVENHIDFPITLCRQSFFLQRRLRTVPRSFFPSQAQYLPCKLPAEKLAEAPAIVIFQALDFS